MLGSQSSTCRQCGDKLTKCHSQLCTPSSCALNGSNDIFQGLYRTVMLAEYARTNTVPSISSFTASNISTTVLAAPKVVMSTSAAALERSAAVGSFLFMDNLALSLKMERSNPVRSLPDSTRFFIAMSSEYWGVRRSAPRSSLNASESHLFERKESQTDHTLRIQICPKKMISPNQSYSGDGIETINPTLWRGPDS